MSACRISNCARTKCTQVGIGERESRRGWGQQLVVRGQLHSPMGKLVMHVAHVAPIQALCFNSKRTSFHVAIELEHVESVDLRGPRYAKRTQFCLSSRVRASAATHSSASRGAAGVVCCFESGCNTSVCQHHHQQVVRVGAFVGLSEIGGTRCSRLHRPIRLKPSRSHSAHTTVCVVRVRLLRP